MNRGMADNKIINKRLDQKTIIYIASPIIFEIGNREIGKMENVLKR